jgi:thiopeptide-type bacteriocin biosynthesis protein
MPADQLAGLTPQAPSGGLAGPGWLHLYVEFTDWAASEQAAARHLAPLLHQPQASGQITGFWFVRKHPCWRLRLRLPPSSDGHALEAAIRPVLDGLADSGAILRWWPGIYEAEEAAFGGPSGMTIAHDLFVADSEAMLRLLGSAEDSGARLGRRELSLALCTTLLHGARLEWYEQGDAWHRVTRERPLPDDVTAEQVSGLTASTRILLATDTSAASSLFEAGGPLANAADWAAAFRQAGEDLGTLARCGTLQRGLREVLSYHVIFHWNRLGLTGRQQAILARACRDAILGPMPVPTSPSAVAATRRPFAPRPDLDQLANRFPLVPRPRPACPALRTRIDQVRQLASPQGEPGGREQRIEQACTALNLAALIASDCRLPALAAEFCERQLAVFQSAGPVTGRVSIASLQPLVNLARLDIRAGHPDRAYQALTQIAEAARHGGAVEVHERSFTVLAGIPAGTDAVNPWIREVLLHDGTRALAAAGHWDQAAEHAAQYDDHPGRLHDARQARIIACVTGGHGEAAVALIDESIRTDPWEHAVAACLRAWAHLATGCPIPQSTTAALALARLAIQPASPGMTLSRTRLGLTAAELATAIDPAWGHLLIQVADDALQGGDGYAAREILGHPATMSFLPQVQHQRLCDIAAAAGIGTGPVPEPLWSELLAGAYTAEAGLRSALQTSADQRPAPSLPGEPAS